MHSSPGEIIKVSWRLVRLLHVKSRFGIAIARIVQRFFASTLIQAMLRPSHAGQARKVEEDFTLPVY